MMQHRWEKRKVRFYIHLGVTKLHPSATVASGDVVSATFSPELRAELRGGGSLYPGAQLGPCSLEVLVRQSTTPRFQ